MRSIEVVRCWLEYLGGSNDAEPMGWPARWTWLVMGLWWGGAIVAITLCCGQTSKFIYIDF